MAESKEYLHTEGNLHISEDVVISVVIGTAKEIEGVYAVAPATAVSNYMKKGGNRGVKVTFSDGELIVDMSMIVQYGVRIPELAEKVQQAVAASVEAMTGYRVAQVNIQVTGVHLN